MNRPTGARRPDQHVAIVSGLSGGGKTAAAKLFEDLGYTVVDNLPGELLPDLAELVSDDRERFDKVAIVLDVRAGNAPVAFGAMRGALEGRGIRPQVFFLEARDEVLIRRFSETRHRHPLADQRGIASSIVEERRLLDPVRAEADVVIDTSDLSLRELRERIFARLGDAADPDRLAIQLISFGFKYGVPLEADLVFDVRFMQNPYYVEGLRQLSGLTEAVRDYVLGQPVARRVPATTCASSSAFALPAYVGEGKTRLTIALGCTGGYHRSIALTEELARVAARGGLRLRSPSSIASSSGPDRCANAGRPQPAALADAGDRRQALAARSSSPGSCCSRSASPTSSARRRRDLQPGGLAQVVLDVVTLQFLPYPLRGLIVGVVGLAPRRDRGVPRGPGPDGPVPIGRGRAARRAHLPEAVPRPRAADRGDRRRHRPVDAAARPEGAHEQPDGGRGRRRRRRARRACSGRSSGSRRSATSGAASPPWPTPSRS